MTERGSLDGDVAVVTGASRGIGKGIALQLAHAGAKVYLTGRTAEVSEQAEGPGSLSETVQEISAAGGVAVAHRCDHADDEEVAAFFARVHAAEGRLDVLVNNAFAVPSRMDPRIPFWETPVADWDVMLDVGTRSAYVATHHAAQVMVPAGRGLVVNVSSAGAVRYFHHVAYGVGKAALDRFTRDAARPLAPHGVAIVSVWPYVVATERVRQMPGFDTSITESPGFVGRAVAALAADPAVMERTGGAFTTHQLAVDYDFTDLDGSMPPEQPWAPQTR